MTNYIVWECVRHEGWEPYEFTSLKEADKFINRKNKDTGTIDCKLTKEINVVVED